MNAYCLSKPIGILFDLPPARMIYYLQITPEDYYES